MNSLSRYSQSRGSARASHYRAASRTKAINSMRFVSRGGIRL